MAAIRFDKLLAYWTPKMRQAFFQAILNVRSLAQIDQLAQAIAAGDINWALRAINLNPVNFRPLDTTLAAAFEAGGNATASGFPLLGAAGGLRVLFQFNVRNPAAEQWLAQESSTLVTEIINDQRDMIRQYLTRAMAAGTNPRTAALDLVGRIGPSGVREGGQIGLTASQQQWVSNYADALMSDNPADALSYVLRDKRFDPAVLSASEGGEPLTADQIQSMVNTYANRALRYRGETIARTEMLTSLHESQQQAMKQAVDQGLVQRDAVSFIWRTANDDRVRDSHVAMEGQEQPMGQPFISGEGNYLRFPGDPFAPPEDVINCFPADTLVQFGKVNLAYRRRYEGELVEILTASGRRLSATKNHPIFTPRGLVAIGALDKGDDLICGNVAQIGCAAAKPDIDNAEASIEKIFDSLFSFGRRMRSAGTPMDFHGDGTYRNVDIVRPAGKLMQGIDSSAVKHLDHLAFANAEEVSGCGSAARSPAQVVDRSFLSFYGSMGTANLSAPLSGAHPRPFQPLGVRLAADWNARVSQDSPRHEPADLESSRRRDLGVPANIELDKVARVSKRRFAGHVFNLETASGYYVANGIFVSNCRCWLEPNVDFLAGAA